MCACKRLPIGIQTLAKICEDDAYCYVDKTLQILRLIDEGTHDLLSRPRHCGKSLLLGSIADLFEGRRELFKCLHAERHWDWSQTYPVIRISLATGVPRARTELEQRILANLRQNSEHLEVVMPSGLDVPGKFSELIRQAHDQRALVLIEEYDKPVLDNFSKPDMARQMSDALRDLYSVLKDEEEHLKPALLTGMSQFAAKALFSEPSPFRDITLAPCYSAICDYTDYEIDMVFAPELPGLNHETMRDWCGGYQWNGVSVHNPAGVWSLFSHREKRHYWFEAGTPTFPSDGLKQASVFTPGLESTTTLAALQKNDTRALLFQPGYLSLVSDTLQGGQVEYRLRYSNREVKTSRQTLLNCKLTSNTSSAVKHKPKLYHLLEANDFTGLQALFTAFFTSIPNEWLRNPITQVRELLRQRLLQPLLCAVTRRPARRRDQPRPHQYDGAAQPEPLSVRVQGHRVGVRGTCLAADQGPRLRGQVPRTRRTYPPDRWLSTAASSAAW